MLTDVQIRKSKLQEKAYRLVDTGGLHLFVTPAGGKLWRLRYKIEGSEKTLSLGKYPHMSLQEARLARDDAKEVLRAGRDPSVQKKIEKLSGPKSSSTTFEEVAREWHDMNKSHWTPVHSNDVIHSLERDIFPHLGNLPLTDITPATVLGVLRMVEARKAKETARRLRQRISGVFVYAISSGIASSDPAAVVSRAMAPIRKGRQPAIVDLDDVITMLRRTEQEPAHPSTKLAIRLLALTAVRPGTLATTPWSELSSLDNDKPVWQIPAERMKLRLHYKDDSSRDHLVPLSQQAVEVIDALRTITAQSPYVFPNTRHFHKPMSENAMGYLLNRAGYHGHHVPHGFRSTFSTIMNERFPADRPIIDFMLAHTPKDKIEGTYNRAIYLTRRFELAQLWADIVLKDAPPAADLLLGPRR